MSIQALSWAIEQQEVTDPLTRWVLVSLANYAGPDGRNAFPSVKRLARDTGLSERAVQYQLKKLRKVILITFGNEAVAAAHIKRLDRRPTNYDLVMKRGAPHAPGKPTGCTTTTNGVHTVASRGAPHAPNPKEEPSLNRKRKSLLKGVSQENLKKYSPAQLLNMPDDELAALAKL